MSTSSHYFHATPTDTVGAEVRRDLGSTPGPVLSIRIAAFDCELNIFLTEDQLASVAEVITEDQDTRPITCETCEGDKVIIVGWEPDFGNEQGDEIEGRCPVCEGEGKIANGEFIEKHDSVWPDEKVARLMFENQVESALGEGRG